MARTPWEKRQRNAIKIGEEIHRLMLRHDWNFGETLMKVVRLKKINTCDLGDTPDEVWIEGLRSVK